MEEQRQPGVGRKGGNWGRRSLPIQPTSKAFQSILRLNFWKVSSIIRINSIDLNLRHDIFFSSNFFFNFEILRKFDMDDSKLNISLWSLLFFAIFLNINSNPNVIVITRLSFI